MTKENSENVWLDLSHLNQKELRRKFPKITNYCKEKNWDFTTDLVPIRPAAHYQCGGITVDKFGATSMNNLFAIGECSHTGLHGSNRLASNSLLEAVVYSHDLAGRLSNVLKSEVIDSSTKPELCYQEINSNEVEYFRNELKKIMNYESVYGSDAAISKIKNAVHLLEKEFEHKFPNYAIHPFLCETYNLIQTAALISSQNTIDVAITSNSVVNQPHTIL